MKNSQIKNKANLFKVNQLGKEMISKIKGGDETTLTTVIIDEYGNEIIITEDVYVP